jgi:hypothetical protein
MSLGRACAWGFFAASVGLCAVFLWHYPAYQIPLAAFFLLYAALLWRKPALWLILVPALLPVLDLAFFSGWFIIDEFDALLLLTLGVLCLRQPLDGGFRPYAWRALLCAFWGVSVLASLGITLAQGVSVDLNSFASYYSSWNGVRVAKGFLWALLLLPFLLAALAQDQASPKRLLMRPLMHLGLGFVIGLTLAMLVLLYERFIFVGLFSFSGHYRATGSFSTMHTGGPAVDSWLALTLPLLLGLFWAMGRVRTALLCACLGVLGMLSILSTGSRTPLLALLTAGFAFVFVLGLALWRAQRVSFAQAKATLLLTLPFVVLIGLLSPLLLSASVTQRLHTSMQDFATRSAHWQAVLKARTLGLQHKILGEGLGTFPKRWFATRLQTRPMAHYHYAQDPAGNRYLKITSGVPLYIGQGVSVAPNYPYLLEFRVRTRDAGATLSFALCEIWLLASMRCQSVSQSVTPNTAWPYTVWQDYQLPLNSGALTTTPGRLGKLAQRPVRLTFFAQNAPTGIDIDALALRGPGASTLLRNGGFEEGHNHWFWQTDAHDHWHMDNLWVGVLFEQGLVGIILLGCLWLAAFWQLVRALWRGDSLASVALASLVGISLVGITQSIFDAPRLTLGVFLMLFTALFWPVAKRAKAA